MNINLDVINYQSLFRVWRYSSSKIGKVSRFFIITKSVIRLVFFKIKFLDKDQKQPKIINSYLRQDYSDFIDKLTVNNGLGRCSIGYQFGLGHKLRYFKDVIRQVKLNKLELNEALFLYFLIKSNDIFLKFIEKESVVILFAEMQILENYIAQLARQVGCHTIGLQHGFYSNDYDSPTVNSLNYKNVAVDEMLVWGLNTKELLLEHNPDLKVTVIGRPSTHFLSHHHLHLNVDSPSSYVAVLDADEFSETNDKILQVVKDLAKRDGVEFFLKCHPSTNLKERSLRCAILRDINLLGEGPHFVGYRSSLLLELSADQFFCMALNESPFLKSDGKSVDNSICWKKLEADDVSDYLACTSIEAESLVVKAISKHIRM
jgi:hypothetical protein